jgi:hypothetical protein
MHRKANAAPCVGTLLANETMAFPGPLCSHLTLGFHQPVHGLQWCFSDICTGNVQNKGELQEGKNFIFTTFKQLLTNVR